MGDKLEELKNIEAQRSDIITKLKKIEEKKHTVSNEVYMKVKTEYEDKLKTLDGEMTKHIDLINTQLHEIETQEKQIIESEQSLNITMEELELRYSIGEYSEQDYNALKNEHQEKLTAAKEQLQTLKERKSWLGNIVNAPDSETTTEPELTPVEEPTPEPEPSTTPEPASEPEVTPEPELTPIPELTPEPESTSQGEETPTLQPIEESETESIQIEEHILEEKLPEEDTKLEELIVEEETAIADAPAESEITETEEPTEQEPPSQPTEKEKSIECPKCRHLNTPDSWYCEKCGAEILDSPIS